MEPARLWKWIEGLPDFRLDGERPTPKALAARLASFWLPSETVVFIGAAEGSLGGRIAALGRHVLGDRRPHPSGQWLKTLAVDGLRVWWAVTPAHEEYEDALLTAFADGVAPAERAALPDPELVLPFANQRAPGGPLKPHGLTGAVAAAEIVAPAPATHVVNVPPGDADGAGERSGAPAKRAATAPARARAAAPRPATPRAPRVTPGRAAAATREAEPLLVSAEGLVKLRADHAALLARRPGVVGRIRAAKEFGDLKENSDYTAAREEQSFLEGRIQALEAQLRAAVVIDAPADRSRVVHGSRVRVANEGEELDLEIVGSTESDPPAGRISAGSPVGRALLGTAVGDEAVVRTPGGERRYRVVAIE
jgi:transcription elongation factor GreA